MSTAHANQKMSAAEYLDWDRQQTVRHEFFDGEVVSQAGGTRTHSLIGTNTSRAIGNLLDDHECEAHGSDMRIHIEATGYYAYPDVSVVCPPVEGEADDVISNPVLVVEVLSPSTEDFDRGTKFGHYRQIPSLRDYLVISQDKARIEHHSRTEDGLWLLRDVEGLDETLHLTSLDRDLSISEVYAKVELD
jgi:Uma2 family endonuclease